MGDGGGIAEGGGGGGISGGGGVTEDCGFSGSFSMATSGTLAEGDPRSRNKIGTRTDPVQMNGSPGARPLPYAAGTSRLKRCDATSEPRINTPPVAKDQPGRSPRNSIDSSVAASGIRRR